MSEFITDIKDKQYDEEGHELDKHGFRVKNYPDGLESVRKSVENCHNMCGLDRKLMERLVKGTYSEYNTFDQSGRKSKKIVIEYDVEERTK